MILLLGGTSQTAAVALALAEAGYRVLVSKATDVALDIGTHPQVDVRWGPLDDAGLAELIRSRGILAIVDAAHPYAVEIHARARRVARELRLSYLALARPASVDPAEPHVTFAADHAAAARAACADGRPVLLTIGSRNLTPYAAEARRVGVSLIVRVLDHPASLAACRTAGIPDACILSGRGPFSVAVNRQQVREFRIGVLVTKDSGESGGTGEKLEAARAEGCRVIVVQRPAVPDENTYNDVSALLRALLRHLGHPDSWAC